MTRTISASYEVSVDFVIPKNVRLLDFNDSNNCNGNPFSWYFRWNALHYFDAKGVQHTIEKNSETHDNKRMEFVNDEDDSSDEYESETDTDISDDSDSDNKENDSDS